jgi:hypothetical protein
METPDFSKMIERPGMKDMKLFAQELINVKKHLTSQAYDFSMPIPNLFFEVKSSFEALPIIDSLQKYLENDLQIMRFSPENKVFAFCLDYSPEDDVKGFPAFKEFYKVITKDLMKFGHPYYGILAIDISQWIDHASLEEPLEKKFGAFLDFMSNLDDETLAVFISQSTNEDKNDFFFREINKTGRTRRMKLAFYDVANSLTYISKYVQKAGLEMTPESQELLKPLLKSIISTNKIDCYLILQNLARDIVFDKLSCSDFASPQITKEDLKRFASGGEWDEYFSKTNTKGDIGLL